MKEALEELEKWDRKYYRYTITSGRHIQPGDGTCVTLEGGGRKVQIEELDLDKENPSIGDVILEAIRLWHADNSMKYYKVYWTHRNKTPDFSAISGLKKWMWWTDTMIQACLEARNEAEVMTRIQDGFKDEIDGKISVYESRLL